MTTLLRAGLCAALVSCAPATLDDEPDPEPEICELPTSGAPVPLRRLTASQLSATVGDVLGVAVTYPISDETLLGYRANTRIDMDATTARSILFAAEEVASFLAPRATRLAECTPDGCDDWVLDFAGPRLFRRPIPESERAPFRAVYDAGFEAGGHAEAVRWLLEAMLQSPRFLYQLEQGDEDGRLDGYSLAARLSYALWGGPPDDALLAYAESGELGTPEGIRVAVEAMVQDPRFERGVGEFVAQWLALESLLVVEERPDILDLPFATRQALQSEPRRYVARAVREGHTVAELLTVAETPTEPALADLYFADIVSGDEELTQLDPARRGGVLTLPGVQAALSHAHETSPSRRGRVVLANIICRPPAPPPDDVVPSLPPASEGQTTRERFEAHFDNDSCAGCHETMDGIGFTFEGYDHFGATRFTDNGHPIDSTGSFLLLGRQIDVDNAVELGAELGDLPEVADCVARHWARFSMGIPDQRDAECLLDEVAVVAQAEGGLREMMVALATSDWFRRLPQEEGR
jgi:hypothetical protein